MRTAGEVVGWDDERLIELFGSVDNAGRWGPDDEIGTLNYITPEKRREGAGLVKKGLTVSLALPLCGGTSEILEIEHRMLYGPGEAADESPGSAGDYLGLEIHQRGLTHLDCLSHMAGYDGRAYNARRFDEVVTDRGPTHGSIYAQREGIVTRGVLLDVAAALGLDWLEPSQEISVPQLEAAERFGGARVTSGDVLVLRTGAEARESVAGLSVLGAGPGTECIPWMHEREVAVYTGDAPERITLEGARILGRVEAPAEEVAPSSRFPLPLHQICIPAMGLVLLDHCRVEQLAQTCRELGRYEFLFVAAPLPLEGGTGSPVNPLAVF